MQTRGLTVLAELTAAVVVQSGQALDLVRPRAGEVKAAWEAAQTRAKKSH